MIKKTFVLILFFLISVNLYSQSNFANGYQKGFKEGYCYQSKQNENVGCIDPLVPISPLSDVSRGEQENNYKDGYHRGFEDGKINFLAQNTSKSENPLYTPRKYPKVYEPEITTLMGMVLRQRNEYQSYIDNISQYYKNLQVQFLVKNQKLLEKVIGDYNSIDKIKLDTLKLNNGWHQILMIYDNKYGFTKSTIKEVNLAKGYIKNGKLINLYRNNYLGYESKIPQAYPNKMLFKRGIIKLSHKYPNGFNQEIILMPLNQYFKPKYKSTPPLKPAKVVLWTKKKRYAGTIVEIDEIEKNEWINNIVKTEVIYSKNPPTECNCNLKPGLVVLKGNKIYPTKFIENNNLSLYNKGYRYYNTIELKENQCIAIEYK